MPGKKVVSRPVATDDEVDAALEDVDLISLPAIASSQGKRRPCAGPGPLTGRGEQEIFAERPNFGECSGGP